MGLKQPLGPLSSCTSNWQSKQDPRDPPVALALQQRLQLLLAVVTDMQKPRPTSGHDLAASTRTGMNDTCPRTVRMTESPSTKYSLRMPHCSLRPVMRMSCVMPRAQPNRAVHLQSAHQLSRWQMILKWEGRPAVPAVELSWAGNALRHAQHAPKGCSLRVSGQCQACRPENKRAASSLLSCFAPCTHLTVVWPPKVAAYSDRGGVTEGLRMLCVMPELWPKRALHTAESAAPVSLIIVPSY